MEPLNNSILFETEIFCLCPSSLCSLPLIFPLLVSVFFPSFFYNNPLSSISFMFTLLFNLCKSTLALILCRCVRTQISHVISHYHCIIKTPCIQQSMRWIYTNESNVTCVIQTRLILTKQGNYCCQNSAWCPDTVRMLEHLPTMKHSMKWYQVKC